MTKNRLMICLLIVGLFIVPINAQVNISFDRFCTVKNCVILSKNFLGAFGDRTVANLLEADARIRVVFCVDTLGRVIKIRRVTSNPPFSESNVRKLENYLIKNDIRFFICFEKPYQDEKKSYNLIHTNDFVKENKYFMSVAFPIPLMDDYDLESKKNPQSKLEYFKKRIKRYLSQE